MTSTVTIKDLIRDYAYVTLTEEILDEAMTDDQRDEAEEALDDLMELIKQYFE